MSWVDVLGFAGCVFLGCLLMWLLERRFPCDCGRSRLWYFQERHERLWVMLLYAAPAPVSAVFGVLAGNAGGACLFAALTVWHVRKVWFHEKGRRRRRSLLGAGRVVLNRHGRLEVRT